MYIGAQPAFPDEDPEFAQAADQLNAAVRSMFVRFNMTDLVEWRKAQHAQDGRTKVFNPLLNPVSDVFKPRFLYIDVLSLGECGSYSVGETVKQRKEDGTVQHVRKYQVDDWCHLNRRGHRLLGKEIARIIKE